MPSEDKTLICVDCGAEFVHSAEDQARYAERGFAHEPKRCRACRDKRKTQGGSDRPRHSDTGNRAYGARESAGAPARESFEVTCAECGAPTTVPFKPTKGRPVYCRDCYRSKRQ